MLSPTFAIDASGLTQTIVRSLRSDDTISIVTYGDEAWPLLDPTPVAEWPRIVAAYPAYRTYQSRTNRVIPVVFLEPASPLPPQ